MDIIIDERLRLRLILINMNTPRHILIKLQITKQTNKMRRANRTKTYNAIVDNRESSRVITILTLLLDNSRQRINISLSNLKSLTTIIIFVNNANKGNRKALHNRTSQTLTANPLTLTSLMLSHLCQRNKSTTLHNSNRLQNDNMPTKTKNHKIRVSDGGQLNFQIKEHSSRRHTFHLSVTSALSETFRRTGLFNFDVLNNQSAIPDRFIAQLSQTIDMNRHRNVLRCQLSAKDNSNKSMLHINRLNIRLIMSAGDNHHLANHGFSIIVNANDDDTLSFNNDADYDVDINQGNFPDR